MGCGDEEATQESSRLGSRQIGRLGSKRRGTAYQPRKSPQRWPGQNPQQEHSCPPQQAMSAPWLQKVMELVIASIRSRCGEEIIGLGHSGIRFAATGDAGVQHARTA